MSQTPVSQVWYLSPSVTGMFVTPPPASNLLLLFSYFQLVKWKHVRYYVGAHKGRHTVEELNLVELLLDN